MVLILHERQKDHLPLLLNRVRCFQNIERVATLARDVRAASKLHLLNLRRVVDPGLRELVVVELPGQNVVQHLRVALHVHVVLFTFVQFLLLCQLCVDTTDHV